MELLTKAFSGTLIQEPYRYTFLFEGERDQPEALMMKIIKYEHGQKPVKHENIPYSQVDTLPFHERTALKDAYELWGRIINAQDHQFEALA